MFSAAGSGKSRTSRSSSVSGVKRAQRLGAAEQGSRAGLARPGRGQRAHAHDPRPRRVREPAFVE